MEKHQSHPFGDLLRLYLSRRQGLSQNKLAAGIDIDPAVIADMGHGRRLTGPLARQRVLAVIRWLHAQDVLHSEEEATALLEAAGMAKLLPNELGIHLLTSETQAPSGSLGQSVGSALHRSQNRLKAQWVFWLIVVSIVIIGIIVLRLVTLIRPQPAWREEFNPIEKRWAQISAVWEDIAGPTAILRENNPDADYGKVESEIITVDVDAYPILHVDVAALDLGASYTVQVLDKRTNIPTDVIRMISYPGEQTANLAQQLGWHGVQSFTLNIWMGGEGKSATFRVVSIEPK